MQAQGRRAMTVDAVIALATVVGCALLALTGLPDWYWSAAVALPLVLRTTAPLAFLVLVAAMSGAHVLLQKSFMFPGDLVCLVAIHAVAAYAPSRWRHLGLLLGVAGSAVVAGQALGDRRIDAALLPAVLVTATTLAAWSTGLMQRQQRRAVLDAEHRRRLAEQDSAMRAQLAVHEERTRISREMHDIIAHSLASIVAQAEGGRAAARTDAVVAGPLFDHIAHTGREALTDVKRLLSVVDRTDQEMMFAEGLDELPDLLTGVTAAGLDVQVGTVGRQRPLAPGMDLAVYRVIQESLTNVLKHAPSPRARLTMTWLRAALIVTVTSPLASDGAAGDLVEGRGLSGVRQRCSLFNGTCTITAGADLTLTTTWPLTSEAEPT